MIGCSNKIFGAALCKLILLPSHYGYLIKNLSSSFRAGILVGATLVDVQFLSDYCFFRMVCNHLLFSLKFRQFVHSVIARVSLERIFLRTNAVWINLGYR